MSDKEGSISRSPSRSVSREKSSSGSIKEPSPVPKVYHSRSRSLSRSRSRSRRKISRSPSRGSRRYSRSRSRSRSRRRYHSRSRSNSPSRRRRSRYDRRRGYYRSHSRSPMSNRRRHTGNRDDPNRSRCLGVFGLSLYTQERDLREIFGRYGPVDECNIVYDHQTGRSRGFAFIYMRNSGDAEEAKEKAPGMEIDGRRIRVDFSITERAHTPTPGIYLGKPTTSTYHRRSASPYSRRGRISRSRSRSRSYSPRRY